MSHSSRRANSSSLVEAATASSGQPVADARLRAPVACIWVCVASMEDSRLVLRRIANLQFSICILQFRPNWHDAYGGKVPLGTRDLHLSLQHPPQPLDGSQVPLGKCLFANSQDDPSLAQRKLLQVPQHQNLSIRVAKFPPRLCAHGVSVHRTQAARWDSFRWPRIGRQAPELTHPATVAAVVLHAPRPAVLP